MTYPDANNHTSNSWHAVRETSVEIAEMIWAEAGGNPAKAQRIWETGSERVDRRAQTLCAQMGEPLQWGNFMFSPED